MATNENLIPIPGRLHSVATEGHVAGADEIYDDTQAKDQETINSELIQAVGSGGSVDSRIAAAKAEIIGNATSACDTLGEAEALISAEATARQSAIGNVIGDAASDYNTLGKLEDKIQAETSARESAVSAEATRAETAEEALDGRVDTLEDAVGTGGSVDSRISAAVATETTRAQGAESALNSGKADKATTLAGYGITDAYTKSETYTKTEVNGLVDTPHQDYVTVATYASLPASGSKDTIYRVSNYNGSTSQVDESVYSEYAWNGSQYVFLCVKSQIGEVFDISVYNNNAKYADLAAALNGGANIPQSLQKGGMSVKFVQSSDNKYVRYNLLAQEFTTDTTQWAIDDVGVYVDNPEFVRVVLDNENKILEAIRVDGTKVSPAGVKINEIIDFEGNETTIIESPEFVEVKLDGAGHILWGIQKDGNVYFGAGVPQQVIDCIEEKIAELSLDEYEDIVAFLDGLEEGDKTLQTLLNEKVDKEEGKSLIDADYASSQSAIENPEYLDIVTDQEDKVIEGTKKDGTKEINVPVSLKSAKIDSAESPEYISVETDNSGKVLSGTKQDGSHYSYNLYSETIDSKVEKEEGKELAPSEIVESVNFEESVEYMSVETDADGKVLGGRQIDGKQFEVVGHNIGGTELLPINDVEERSEIVADGAGKVIAYRDKNGIKHENAGLDAKFVLSDANKKTLYENLKSLGYNFMDWSNAARLEIDMPKCAYINIISPVGWPTTKTQNTLAELEFYDMQGNYFMKYIILNAQGASSLALPKKNAALDLYVTKEDAINDENTFELKFGNWLAFDSYHIKAYYSDQFKCCNPVCYKLYQQIADTRGIYNDRIWKRALLDFSELGPVPGEEGSVFSKNLIFDEAIGYPDGFPCIAYLNGDFYGVYAWQIKKHRDNYKQDKATASNVHLDVYQTDNSLWAEPSIKWSFTEAGNTTLPIEIRNPKNLYYKELHWVGGKNTLKYDGDYPYEIAGSTEVESWIENEQLPDGTWPSKPKDVAKLIKNLRITAQVKDYILTLSDYVREMQAAAAIYEASEKTAEDLATLKAAFEERFDKESIIDYIITIDLGGVTDSVTNNVQWLTYDGVKWFASPYDMDRSFRQGGTGGPYDKHIAYGGDYSVNTPSPITLFCKYYEDELDARYKELADKGIASVDGIFSIFKKWIDAVGSNNYILDADKWQEGEITDNMYRLHKFIEEEVSNMDSVYSYTRI